MKLITLSQIGFNHPSGANWSWGIFKLDLIDTEKTYCMSYVLKENFGGDKRFLKLVESATGHIIIETKSVYLTQNITGIREIKNMEDKEFLEIVKEFLKVGVNYESNEPIY